MMNTNPKFIRKLVFISFFVAASASTTKSQDTLTLNEAVTIAFQNNQSIRVAMNQASQRENSAHPGNANLLPSVSLSTGFDYSNENQNTKFSGNIPEEDIDNAVSTTNNASINLDYTVFDGMSNIFEYQKLKEEAKGSKKQAKATIEGVFLQVANAYYRVARLQETFRIARQSAELSQERLQRTETAYQYGDKSKVEVLNAQVDLDTDSTNMIEAKVNYQNALRDFNVVLGREEPSDYIVSKEVNYRKDFSLEELEATAKENHPSIQAGKHQVQAARLEKKMATGAWFPQIGINGSYNYRETNSDAGIVRKSTVNGFNGGVTLSIPLYNGSRKSIRSQNARINIDSRQQELEQTMQEISRDLKNAYATHNKNLRILNMEQRSVQNAQLNFERSREAYRLGQINSTQLREAQLNLIRAEIRLTQARYDAKLSEMELLRHSGQLQEQFRQ